MRDAKAANSGQGAAFVARKANQPSEGYHYGRVLAPSGSTTMHRKEMVDVFLRNLPPSYAVHTSRRLVSYERIAGEDLHSHQQVLMLHFADNTTAEADLLIGADGIHSVVRSCMYEEAHRAGRCGVSNGTAIEECTRYRATKPVWTGILSYRCLIPTEKLYALNPNHTTAGIGAILCVS